MSSETPSESQTADNRKSGEFQVPKYPPSKHPATKHSPHHHHHHPYAQHSLNIPSPVPCRRTRTTSLSLMAADSPLQQGTIVKFCREKGHGFVKPDDEEKPIFLHISDIEEDYVVRPGDRVEFRTVPMPPKRVEQMAVEVHLLSLDESVPHERWDKLPDH